MSCSQILPILSICNCNSFKNPHNSHSKSDSAVSEQFQCRTGAVPFDIRNFEIEIDLFQCNFGAISEQFQCSFSAVSEQFPSSFRTVSVQLQGIKNLISEQFQSIFRAVSEQLRSSFRVLKKSIYEQFRCNLGVNSSEQLESSCVR